MGEVATYEYAVSTVDDNITDANNLMKVWAEAGWELVSGAVTSWSNKELGTTTEPIPPTIWHTKFVMYWRKPVT